MSEGFIESSSQDLIEENIKCLEEFRPHIVQLVNQIAQKYTINATATALLFSAAVFLKCAFKDNPDTLQLAANLYSQAIKEYMLSPDYQ